MNPRETVELAYRATDAFNRRDLDAFVRDFGDLTVAALRARGHGAGSDTPLDERVWQVARWRRGKCVLFRIFNTRVEAFEAMGLSA